MAQISLEILAKAKKLASSGKRRATISIKKKRFPTGINFICPYCEYVGKKSRQGSARITGNEFNCYACGERRKVEW